MSLEEHHRFILNAMDRQTDIARKLIEELEAKNAALAAENERLRKAGDEVIDIIWEDDDGETKTWNKAIIVWNAAKEGGDAK